MIYILASIYCAVRLYSAYKYFKSRKRYTMTHLSNLLMAVFMTSMLLASSWGYLLVAAIDSKSQADQVDTWDPDFELLGNQVNRGMMYVLFTTAQIAAWIGISWMNIMLY